MVKKSRGFRTRSRKKLKAEIRRKGITRFLRKFDIGQRVVIYPDPSSHRGMPHHRFKGKIGKIVGKRGKAYIVEIKNGKKIKKVISMPEHLKPF
ncbi:MAG: 50S ribosomal protein L21e [Candidatus Aenigmarchaeota archaeon ex4484_224]|nr:MAG: 50S ribosomal protein L21e [Candidatus Aenigmarchaeota archaeon ex4484_224]